MEAGKTHLKQDVTSPILKAINGAEKKTTGEIRVHLSRHFFENDPLKRAQKIFFAHKMDKTPLRNGVLLYVNIRKRHFALYGDEGLHKKVGDKYWNGMVKALREDFQSTHFERAISIAVRTIGFTLQHFFPLSPIKPRKNELSNEVTRD